MKATATPVEAVVFETTREPRCRMRNRLGEGCPNPSLDPDPGAVQICVRHVREVLELIREHRERVLAERRETTS